METKLITKRMMGKNLRDLRISRNKSIADVSHETGLGEAALRNYECGLRIPNYKAMFVLASYYQTSVDRIFFAG